MSKSLVTESAEMLCNKAEKDILTVKVLSEKKFYPTDLMYDIICFHATQAVEKLLKSYIISNNKTIEKIHNLDILQKAAMEIDNSFLKIMENCLLLNGFIPNVRYDDENPVTKQHIGDILKSLNAICNFPPIKTMRDSFGKEHKYEIVAEVTASSANKC
ncbi:MAG: HEPN domain-containing protein [Treponema sp.]|jgi:HEPN domain-containing protein|nr:HEPN domain-containing protein [Treponema sp.]